MSGSYINGKSFLKGAFLVSGAALIGKVLSALYRVPFQNITGDLGYYVYQQIYPFYGAAMVISLYGFPVITSKIVMEALEKQGKKAAKETAIAVFFLLLLVCVPVFLLLFLGAGFTARLMGDKSLIVPLCIISVVFLFIPLLSAGRGYFQGIGEMRPTAVSHLLEQSIRVTFILVLAWFAIEKGPYAAGGAAAIGSIAGSACGVFFLWWCFFSQTTNKRINWISVRQKIKDNHIKVMSRGILLSLSAMIFILYQLIDAFTVARLLEANGMSALDAKAAKGVFDRGQPLLQFGTVIAVSFALAVVPLISREKITGNIQSARYYAAISVRTSLLIGAAAALGLFIITAPVNLMLFENTDGTHILRLLAVTLGFSGLVMATSAVMQGHHYFFWPAFTLLVGLFVKAVGNIVLIPLLFAKGAALATVLGMAVTAVWNLFFMYKKKLMDFPSLRWLLKAGTSLGIMGLVVLILSYFYPLVTPDMNRMGAAFFSLLASCIGVFVFIIMVFRFSLFTKEERMLLPGMNKVENLKTIVRKEKERIDDS